VLNGLAQPSKHHKPRLHNDSHLRELKAELGLTEPSYAATWETSAPVTGAEKGQNLVWASTLGDSEAQHRWMRKKPYVLLAVVDAMHEGVLECHTPGSHPEVVSAIPEKLLDGVHPC
jgi:hypothetical protein